jgi:cyclopropane fatty-acyl-phospholipid synthase-like methyltransferase
MNFIKRLFFHIWYFRKPPWDTNQTPPELYEFMQSNPPGRALDLGCGTGTNVIALAKHGWQATGVDFIPKAIKAARKKAHKAGVDVNLEVGDVTRLDAIEGPFDLILDIGCYHSLDSEGMKAYRQQVRRLLAPGGSYLIYLFFKTEDQSSAVKGSNATEADLKSFLDFLELEQRQDGEERGLRRSAWLTYRNQVSKHDVP